MSGLFGGGNTISQTEQVMAGMQIQQSTYGVAVPIVYGTRRLSPNLIYYTDFTPIPHTTSQKAGKGGGGSTMTQTTYTYTAALILALCEGPIIGINTIWADKDVIKAQTNFGSGATLTALDQMGGVPFLGPLGQAAWSYVTTKHPGEALGYTGLAYAAFTGIDLGNTGHLKNMGFEVIGKLRFPVPGGSTYLQDSNPCDVLTDFLTNSVYGAGFPSARIGDWTSYSAFCRAQGVFLSPVFEEKKPAKDSVDDLFIATNSAPFWSGDRLKIVPYADQVIVGNGVVSFGTFTPNVAPLYDLSDDDYLSEGGSDPIQVTRSTPADAWNQVQVEFVNRDRDYNIETAEAKDSANIEVYGLRTSDPVKLHMITEPSVAQVVAQAILQRKLYIRNQYEFRLGWKYCLLEAMDGVTLTDALLGMTRYLVRVTEVEENEFGDLTVKAEDWPLGASAPPTYGTQVGLGYVGSYNDSPGDVNPPVIMEPYFQQTNGSLELWVAACGGVIWGQAQVWVSLTGDSYTLQGEITAPSRIGVLTSQLPSVAAAGLDTASTATMNMTQSRSQILSGSDSDLNSYATLCYSDGEWLAYRDSVLTSAYNYSLTRLQRGLFGSSFGSHAAGKQFIRVDDTAVLKIPIRQDQIGTTLYLKFLSRNVFGSAQQSLTDVEPYIYVIQGTALTALPANPANLCTVYQGNLSLLQWDAVADFRAIDYEVRKGPVFATAQVLGRTSVNRYPCVGSGTYWVAARFNTAYSLIPPSLTITGQLVQNVIQTWDEAATSWAGIFAGGAYNNAGAVQLTSAGLMSTITLISGVTSFLALGSVSPSGTYDVPAVHEVDVLNAQPCTVTANYTSQTINPYSLISLQPSIAGMASIIGSVANKCSVVLQINVADQSLVYGGWQNFIPGVYSGRKFKMRANLSSSDPALSPSLTAFSWTVDVPDRAERGTNIAVAALGTAITYARPFQQVPNLQVTILNAVAGDDVTFTVAPGTGGFTVKVLNAGAGVARNINWFAQGY